MVDNDKADELLLADCIEYHKAIHMLSKRLGATSEELAIWAFLGTECGGLDIYTKESGQPEKLPFVDGNFSHDYLPRLRRCWFRRSDVEQFEPQERFITGAALIERWRQYDKDPEDLILVEISRDHLEAYHPVFGGYSQELLSGNDNFPPLSEYLIAKSGVESVEARLAGSQPKQGISLLGHTADQNELVTVPCESLGLISKELEGWFDKDFDELPEEKRQSVTRSGLKIYWNALAPEERQEQACRRDLQHDPALEKHFRDLCGRMNELEIELKEWQTIPTPTAVDLETQKRKERECQEEISRIQLQLNEPYDQDLVVAVAAADQVPLGMEPTVDDFKWGWPDMKKSTGLTRDEIRYRAQQLGFEIKKQNSKNKNSRPGLMIWQLNKIAHYKRSNAAT